MKTERLLKLDKQKLIKKIRKLEFKLEKFKSKKRRKYHHWNLQDKLNVLYLRDIEDMTFSDICKALNLTQKDARLLYVSARYLKLKDRLEVK